ncbi:hypothetical protein IMZ48_34890 [Candidatus Bathyarchaeota archaeon]|nr:hypothetical protein [Candidatus Bathyarchaeota archaeon]
MMTNLCHSVAQDILYVERGKRGSAANSLFHLTVTYLANLQGAPAPARHGVAD